MYLCSKVNNHSNNTFIHFKNCPNWHFRNIQVSKKDRKSFAIQMMLNIFASFSQAPQTACIKNSKYSVFLPLPFHKVKKFLFRDGVISIPSYSYLLRWNFIFLKLWKLNICIYICMHLYLMYIFIIHTYYYTNIYYTYLLIYIFI